MSYPEAIQFLYGLRLFGAELGLENTFQLAALAGHPQNRLRFIHVAGTNGKGSTCAMLESIYRAAGLRVGLFTSPHLVSFRERIQINRRWIGEDEVVRLVGELQPWLKSISRSSSPDVFRSRHRDGAEILRRTALRPGDLGNRPGRTPRRDQHCHAAGQCHHQYPVRSPSNGSATRSPKSPPKRRASSSRACRSSRRRMSRKR